MNVTIIGRGVASLAGSPYTPQESWIGGTGTVYTATAEIEHYPRYVFDHWEWTETLTEYDGDGAQAGKITTERQSSWNPLQPYEHVQPSVANIVEVYRFKAAAASDHTFDLVASNVRAVFRFVATDRLLYDNSTGGSSRLVRRGDNLVYGGLVQQS